MTDALAPLDISDAPELLRIAEEVQAANAPRVLRRGDDELAVIIPLPSAALPRKQRTRTAEDHAAFLASAGSWVDEDTDALTAKIYESRRTSRPPVDL